MIEGLAKNKKGKIANKVEKPVSSDSCCLLLSLSLLFSLYGLITRTLFVSLKLLRCSLYYQCLACGNSRTLDGSEDAPTDDACRKKTLLLLEEERARPCLTDKTDAAATFITEASLDQNKLLIQSE